MIHHHAPRRCRRERCQILHALSLLAFWPHQCRRSHRVTVLSRVRLLCMLTCSVGSVGKVPLFDVHAQGPQRHHHSQPAWGKSRLRMHSNKEKKETSEGGRQHHRASACEIAACAVLTKRDTPAWSVPVEPHRIPGSCTRQRRQTAAFPWGVFWDGAADGTKAQMYTAEMSGWARSS